LGKTGQKGNETKTLIFKLFIIRKKLKKKVLKVENLGYILVKKEILSLYFKKCQLEHSWQNFVRNSPAPPYKSFADHNHTINGG
jgi:hypothetical protein